MCVVAGALQRRSGMRVVGGHVCFVSSASVHPDRASVISFRHHISFGRDDRRSKATAVRVSNNCQLEKTGLYAGGTSGNSICRFRFRVRDGTAGNGKITFSTVESDDADRKMWKISCLTLTFFFDAFRRNWFTASPITWFPNRLPLPDSQ